MRSREFVREQFAPGQTPGAEGQDIGKLTATITDLQKQVSELQKAALQQSEPPPITPAPTSTPASDDATPKIPQGTVGTTTQSQIQQPATQVKPGTPMGQQPPAGQAVIKPVTGQSAIPVKTPPSVSQPSQITNMKIKQQLATNQAGGTK